ncbi:hypothetical protein [Catellatospora tritici]|uniref:hypothetical protein n=1 Tax=Catellatospora tritici TaxID=2851566 RepID=UPI001C2D1960|nr:hypothetical protein [Catellatospora tritici]MBV1850736.1 hypothetical protein [Catellatospora tritici]MBV1850989.1 hypothetical protein [Catellatospora tritici]
MVEPYERVNYDYASADQLRAALVAAVDRTHQVIEQRRGERRRQLGDQPGLSWQGKYRRDFDSDFNRQQKALMALEEDLRDVLRVLDRTTQQAHDANLRHR